MYRDSRTGEDGHRPSWDGVDPEVRALTPGGGPRREAGPTQLLAVGYQPPDPLAEQDTVPAYPRSLRRDDLDEVAAVADETVTAGGTVVAVLPRWADEPSLRRLQTVRAALDTRRFVIHASDLPPLAGGVVVALLDALRCHLDAARLVAALPELSRRLVVVARLARLSGLRDPAPTVWQHALSLLPGTAFGVRSHPSPSVRRLTRAEPGVAPPSSALDERVGLAVASRGAKLNWVHEVVAPMFGDPPVVEADPSPLAGDWWGPGRSLEAVAYPADVEAVARDVAARTVLRRCEGCDEDSPLETCPFCGLSRPPAHEGAERADGDSPADHHSPVGTGAVRQKGST